MFYVGGLAAGPIFDRYYPCCASICQWFYEKRGLALGLTMSGSAVGGAAWPFLIEQFLSKVKLEEPRVHRIIFGISMMVLPPAILLVRERRDAAGHDASGQETASSEKGVVKALFKLRFLALCGCLTLLYSQVHIYSYNAQRHGR
ncbi:hypothetical protein JDV02_002284 [Purpureocillium takamizusanense]|uniref:Monocarboxylate transporter n=1 Tax=Purpureocillium takamizusanense TaxID=2060973 RepID=A0A9Q8V8G7_9HYPO|nr:uncharacterized protein JDV02_002284 [Purpureocillium takamizusanense]UNI15782.1 hypothetical protein JDV02_002284 [Purpureocillium takamizusanense]